MSEPVVVPPETPKPHWIDDETARKRFWSWTGNTLGMTNTEVHAALGVKSMTEYTGTMADCKAALMAWVNKQASTPANADYDADMENEKAKAEAMNAYEASQRR
jgi:hypothetical protein